MQLAFKRENFTLRCAKPCCLLVSDTWQWVPYLMTQFAQLKHPTLARLGLKSTPQDKLPIRGQPDLSTRESSHLQGALQSEVPPTNTVSQTSGGPKEDTRIQNNLRILPEEGLRALFRTLTDKNMPLQRSFDTLETEFENVRTEEKKR